MFQTVNSIIQRVLGLAGALSGLLLLALVATILADVIGRNAFNSGSTQLQELEWHLNAAIFLLALGYAYSRGAHVRIDVVAQRFSPRTKAVIEVIGIVFLLIPYCFALISFGADYWSASYAFNEASASATGLPYRWILKGVMVFGFVLLGLSGIAVLVDRLIFLFEGKGSANQPDAGART